jgi:hypothetical protein
MDYEIKDNAIRIQLDRRSVASLVFHIEGNLIFLDSTFTPPQFRGKGVGSELVKASIEYAKKNNLTIVPVCEFAVEYFKKHAEYGDLVKS